MTPTIVHNFCKNCHHFSVCKFQETKGKLELNVVEQKNINLNPMYTPIIITLDCNRYEGVKAGMQQQCLKLNQK